MKKIKCDLPETLSYPVLFTYTEFCRFNMRTMALAMPQIAGCIVHHREQEDAEELARQLENAENVAEVARAEAVRAYCMNNAQVRYRYTSDSSCFFSHLFYFSRKRTLPHSL